MLSAQPVKCKLHTRLLKLYDSLSLVNENARLQPDSNCLLCDIISPPKSGPFLTRYLVLKKTSSRQLFDLLDVNTDKAGSPTRCQGPTLNIAG